MGSLFLPRRDEEEEALTDWEDEAPPSHVKWKAAGGGNHDDSDDEPDNGKAPQHDADEDTDDVEHVACARYMGQGLGGRKESFSEFTEEDYACCGHTSADFSCINFQRVHSYALIKRN